jgi:hypothetical protein
MLNVRPTDSVFTGRRRGDGFTTRNTNTCTIHCLSHTAHVQLLALDRRRNGNREALAYLRGAHGLPSPQAPSGKVWVSVGPLFVRLQAERVKDLLEQDQKTISTEVDSLRDTVREHAQQLAEIEGRPEIMQGMQLKPAISNVRKPAV